MRSTGTCTYALGKTSWGWVGVAGTDRGVIRVLLPYSDRRAARAAILDDLGPILEDPAGYPEVFAALERYFAGERVAFDFPLAPPGTPFQLAVWEAVRRIPHGETRSYGQIAAAVGRPRGAHAVGQAVARAPLGVIIPCHRVIAADGTIGWFGRYGESVDLKRRLLALEGVASLPDTPLRGRLRRAASPRPLDRLPGDGSASLGARGS